MRRNDSGELLDKNGLTEREFLAAYRADRYPRPSVTADIMLLSETPDGVETLLIRRGGHPYLGCWALPGGFAGPSERVEQAAARELEEETHVADLPLYPLMLCSAPGRDPRGWTISQAYLALVRRAELPVQAGDDAAEACWFSLARTGVLPDVTLSLLNGAGLSLTARLHAAARRMPFGDDWDISVTNPGGVAFDHAAILLRGLLAYEARMRRLPRRALPGHRTRL